MLFPIQVYQVRKLRPYLLLYNSEIGLIGLSFIFVCLFRMDIFTYTVNEALMSMGFQMDISTRISFLFPISVIYEVTATCKYFLLILNYSVLLYRVGFSFTALYPWRFKCGRYIILKFAFIK
jgi:hypothetical protein